MDCFPPFQSGGGMVNLLSASSPSSVVRFLPENRPLMVILAPLLFLREDQGFGILPNIFDGLAPDFCRVLSLSLASAFFLMELP